MKKKAIRIGIVFLTLFIIFALSVPGAMAKPLTIRAQTFLSSEDMTDALMVQPTFDAIEKVAGNAIKLKRYPEGALVGFREMLTGVMSGAIDLAPMGLGNRGDIPDGLYQIESLPMAWPSGEDAFKVYYEHGMLDLFREVMAKHFNVHIIGPGAAASWGFTTSFPVKSLKDFKGKKFRAHGYAELFKKLGAAPANVPFPELYMALQLGTIDGIIFTYPELESMKLKEVAPYVIKPFLNGVVLCSWVMNMDKWKALPSDTQKKIEQVVKDQFLPCYHAQKKAEQKIFDDPKVTVVELPKADADFLKSELHKTWDYLVADKGPLGKKAIDIIRNYYKK